MRVAAYLRNHALNFQGKTIERKVIVFESDDWGGIRIPSKQAYDKLVNAQISLDKNPYNRFDSLETPDDISSLLEVIEAHKDYKGNHPVLTANFIVGNPDFERIEKGNFEEYHYETMLETYKRSKATINSWNFIQEGIAKKLIHPQFHGREHVNAMRWLEYLRSGHKQFRSAFSQGVFSIDHSLPGNKRSNLMATLDYENEQQRTFAYEQLQDGFRLFERLFKMPSESFIAPCNVWDTESEKILSSFGVKTIQSFLGQLVPSVGTNSYRKKIHRIGQLSGFEQIYLVRNVYFEPSTLSNYDWIGNALRKIEAAFFWNKPAIISTHRLNFIGSLSSENRKHNLKLFDALLKQILTRWPNVEFMTSDKLGQLYKI